MRIETLLDFDLELLRDSVGLVDGRLDTLEAEARLSSDPDSFGLFDKMEYVTGFGFVACQAYATAVVSQSDLRAKRRAAHKLGPVHRSGRSMLELVHAAANYWKHNAEWVLDGSAGREQDTIEVISSVGIELPDSYVMAKLLHAILTPHAPRFEKLLPFLTQWRDELLR